MEITSNETNYVRVRLRRSVAGLTINVWALPEVEDLIKSWGTGEVQDISVHGREWRQVGEIPLTVYQLSDMYGVLNAGGETPYRIDIPGRGVIAEADEERPQRNAANLSFLRLVGISKPEGISFQIKGVQSWDGVKTAGMKIQNALRNFTISYMKEYEVTIQIVGKDFSRCI